MAFKPSPSRQAHKLAIVTLCLGKKVGDMVTKTEISEVTQATEKVWRSSVSVAKAMLRREHQVNLVTVKGVGYRIGVPVDAHGVADRNLAGAHRRAKVAKEVLETVSDDDFKAMSRDEQGTHIGTKTRTMIVYDVTAPRRLKALSSAVSNGRELPTGIEKLGQQPSK